MNLLFIDTETTGLDPQNDRVVQIAGRMALGPKLIEFCTYIQPEGFEIPESASAIHGISTQFAQANGLPIQEVLEMLDVLVDLADRIVGHHIIFDVRFLAAEARRSGREKLADKLEQLEQVCTKKLSLKYLQDSGKPANRSTTKLETMFELFLNEKLEDAHDALTDVIACEMIHKKLVAA